MIDPSPELVKDTAQAIEGVVKAVPIYQDALQPLAKQVGKSLGTVGGVINIALSPFAAMVYGFDLISAKLKTKLEKKLKDKDPARLVAPPLYVVGPLLDKYRYVHDQEELADMFVNLLAYSMDEDTVKKAHPSFVGVISELCSDEARLIKYISKQKVLPKIEIRARDKGEEGYSIIERNFTTLGEDSELDVPQLTSAYLDNLVRLGILKHGDMGTYYTSHEHCDKLEKHPKTLAIIGQIEKAGRKSELTQGILEITAYGRLFIEAVVS